MSSQVPTSRPAVGELPNLLPRLVADEATSTIEIAGVRFPIVGIVCPAAEGTDWSEDDRTLAAGRHYGGYWFIPAENGVLFEVTQADPCAPAFRQGSLSLSLLARTCRLTDAGGGEESWLPHAVGIVKQGLIGLDYRNTNGLLGAVHGGTWDDCDHEWVAETIQRLSAKPYAPPPGPEVRLIRLTTASHIGGPT